MDSMRNKAVVFLAAAFVYVPALLAQRGNPVMALGGQSVDGMIAEFMREHAVPGMAVAIVQAPYITRATGYGVSDSERRTLVSANTIFNIAQMKNAFTAVAVMQLVETGKAGLDDPVAEAQDRTIRQLLRRPGDYAILERLINRASGGSYEDFITKWQFEPLGLRHTFFGRDLDAVARESLQSGERHRRFLQVPSLIDPTEPATGYRSAGVAKSAPSAIYSSASDISVWDIGLAGQILIKDPALRKLLYAPPVLESGVKLATSGPWIFPGHEGLMIATGSGEGFSSLLSRFTKSDELVCVTLLANKEGLDLTQLARRIAGAHNPKIGPPPRAVAMRVQQSPYSIEESIGRLERALRQRAIGGITRVDRGKTPGELLFGSAAIPLRAAAWEENGEVWLAASDPGDLETRGAIDAALLEAVSPR